MADDPMLEVLAESEQYAGEVLAKRREVVDLDRKRNKNREALRAISKLDKNEERKIWLCSGNMFIKAPLESATEIIKSDQESIEQNISTLRDEIKATTEKLRQLEGKDTSAFSLKALSTTESAALRDLLPKTM